MKNGTATTVLAAVLLLAAWRGWNQPATDAAAAAGKAAAPPGAPASAWASASASSPRPGGMFVQFAALGETPVAASDIALTDDQQLIPDMALKKLMDASLLDHALTPAQAMQALSARLRRSLPPAPAAEAIALAARYQDYLSAHDALLAAQHFTSADAATQDQARIQGWQRQRQQLRQRMLGERVTLEWFGNDDAYLDQALAEWRQRSDGTAQADHSIAAQDQALHDEHMRRALDQAIAGYRGAAGGP